MVCMAGLQVFIVRFFFQGARKGEFGAILIWGLEDLLTWVHRVCMNMGMVHWRGRALLYVDIFCRFQYPVLGCGSATPDQITALCSGSNLQRCCSGHPPKAPWHSKIATYPRSAIYHQIYTNLSTTLTSTKRLPCIDSPSSHSHLTPTPTNYSTITKPETKRIHSAIYLIHPPHLPNASRK